MAVELHQDEIASDAIEHPTISADSAGIRMTPDEFYAIEDWDDNYRYELIHGVLVVSPPASRIEVDLVLELSYLLRAYSETRSPDPIDLALFEQYMGMPDSVRRPDVSIWIGLGRIPDERLDKPTIAVEFVSPGKRAWRRDYVEKRAEYLDGGIKEYWVIDRHARSMTVYARQANQDAELQIAENEVYQTELLPGFELPVARLFARADRFAKPPGAADDKNSTKAS